MKERKGSVSKKSINCETRITIEGFFLSFFLSLSLFLSVLCVFLLFVYHEKTEPLIGFYRSRGLLTDADGVGEVAEVAGRVERALAGQARGVA